MQQTWPARAIQQRKVFVNLSNRADRASSRRPCLSRGDRNGRRYAFDTLGVGLFQRLEELPRVSGERFDVAPLAFCVERVEGQRTLARAADSGHGDHLAQRKVEVDSLEVMSPDLAKPDHRWARSRSGAWHQSGLTRESSALRPKLGATPV